MRDDLRSRRRFLPVARPVLIAGGLAVLLLGLPTLVAQVNKGKPRGPKAVATPVHTTGGGEGATGVTDGPATWKEVDRLVLEQKYEAASAVVARIRAAAQAKGEDAEWAKALIKEVQLRTGLHGYETSVRFLRDQAWPKEPMAHATLELFYASSLVTYQQAYSWEIAKREKVDTKGAVDLKAWTREEIFAEAQRAYLRVWELREALGKEKVGKLSQYLNPNNYPETIRGTLRDAVTYLFVELLGDTSSWRPEQSNEIYQLSLTTLLGAPKGPVALADPAVHPLVRIAALLDDLESWHAKQGRREAAFEARLERLRRLQLSFTEAADRLTVKKDLESRLPGVKDVSWWAMGMGTLADFVEAEDRPDNLVKARELAEQGRAAYPESLGGQKCLSIVKRIEAPAYGFTSMQSDGAGKRSIQLTHKNLPKVYFRAFPYDLEKRLSTARDYNLLPNGRELTDLVKQSRSAARWSVELPATPDFKQHLTFVTPPLKKTGAYVIAISAREDFEPAANQMQATLFLLSDLVLVTRQTDDGSAEVLTLSGETGKPIAGADVTLYRFDWQQGHSRVETQTSREDGQVVFAGAKRTGNQFFLLGKRGDDLALDSSYLYFYPKPAGSEVTASLVYTDRSIYRPNQKVLWKVVAYQGVADQARYTAYPEATLTVQLLDANYQRVDSIAVKTNAFGSATGEFTIPAGRVLGQWTVQSSLSGQTQVRVEEYKRPTFEAQLVPPKAALRLNRPAVLRGEVKYYFGLPVVNGSVKWRVTREPVYPWWWGWWWGVPQTQSQTVATGTTSLKEDGTFEVAFTPKADERKGKDITYRYGVSADVTDEGGETRSASRSFRLGFVAVEASLNPESAFFRSKEKAFDSKASVAITRSDLDGTPRAGKGTYRLVRLVQPERTLLPADQPGPAPKVSGDGEGARTFQTEGDGLKPRWTSLQGHEQTLRAFKDGEEVVRGALTHDDKGKAEAVLPSLDPGPYRLHYQTTDDFGATYDTFRDFLVAGRRSGIRLPALLLAEEGSVKVGETARLLVLSGLPDQLLFLDTYRAGKLVTRRRLDSGKDSQLIEIPITEAERGGLGFTLSALRDHQFMQQSQSVFVPWDDRELKVEFATFRDKMRPGARETWKVTVKGSDDRPEAGSAEVLAYMYDRSLDIFGAHNPPSALRLLPSRTGAGGSRASLGAASPQWIESNGFPSLPGGPYLHGDTLQFLDGYGIGGPGRRGGGIHKMGALAAPAPVMGRAMVAQEAMNEGAMDRMEKKEVATKAKNGKDAESDKRNDAPASPPPPPAPTTGGDAPVALRSDFSETAFWRPSLLTDAAGSASIEFTVPDSVTSWNVWVHALTKQLHAGSLHKETKSVKDLMVRPYIPRFLREGDSAEIKVVVNNASTEEMKGQLRFDILDPETNQSILSEFGLSGGSSMPFTVKAGGGTNLSFGITAPRKVRTVAFKVTAVAGDLSDGELRPLPVLPSRMHLAQSRFVTLRNRDRKTMTFDDLAREVDPSRINEQMVVTVDAQLFYTVLQALPYLVNYPYECTEQTLNRFVSTGIVSSLYKDYPAIATMAEKLSKRDTPLESWDQVDPNRKMTLEESPWVRQAKGGEDAGYGLTNVLDPRVAKADRDASLAKLRKAQTANGAFPWWPGGPPSPYMTLYIMHGLAKAAEFGVDVPKDMVQRGWQYLGEHFRGELRSMMAKDCCWEFLTFLNYVASCYPDPSWVNDAITAADRKDILDFSFKHWRQHSPYLKGYLALTLKRANRLKDAQLVWDSVMDSAKTTEDQGTFWAQEDRSWLWYNDTIETRAFALRTLTEMAPKDARRDGLVQWLLINKKLNQWKSTRATAEVIYSLLHYLKGEGALGIREDATVTIGAQKVAFTFEPDQYTGKKNQIVVPGEKIDPKTTSTIVVEKESKGFVFASATWHFSTEKMPAEDRGDFFNVSRTYFKRENDGRQWVLKPLADGAPVAVGDQIEIQISLRSKHAAEYVHLRDPRGAGFESENAVSRYKWDLGISWYEETRDSGTNFFFEQLPVGEYTFKYRLRANMAGTFRVGPATVQSMYAPEFNAYSTGAILKVVPAK